MTKEKKKENVTDIGETSSFFVASSGIHRYSSVLIIFTIFHFTKIFDSEKKEKKSSSKKRRTDIQIQKIFQSVEKDQISITISSAYLFGFVYSVRSSVSKIIFIFQKCFRSFSSSIRSFDRNRKKAISFWINCCLFIEIMQFFLTIHDSSVPAEEMNKTPKKRTYNRLRIERFVYRAPNTKKKTS